MTELLLKVFNKKEYWRRKAQEMHDIMVVAEFRYNQAVKNHRRSADLHFDYKLARLNFEKAAKEHREALGV